MDSLTRGRASCPNARILSRSSGEIPYAVRKSCTLADSMVMPDPSLQADSRFGFGATGLRLHLRHCLTASVEHLIQRGTIYAVTRADGDNPGPWFSAIPSISNGDIHALADD